MSIAFETDVEIVIQAVDPVPADSAPPRLLHVVSCRSEAVRIAAVIAELRRRGVPQAVARVMGPDHTHGTVLDADCLPQTEVLVAPAAGTTVQRTARTLMAAEEVLTSTTPELLVIAGDTAASLAFALAASKLGIPIVRVGGGLRCGDFSVGEELNRILADRLADIVFTDSPEATDALHAEGIAVDRVREVGSTTVDLLHRWAHQARRRAVWKDLGVEPYGFVLITLHRAENVGNDERVARFTEAVARLGERLPVVLPLHPATRAALTPMGDLGRLESAGVRVVDPLGYLDFLSLEQAAGAVVTDSAGVQEETSALGVRCHTLRRSTERVATLVRGTNVLLGDDPEELRSVRIGAPVDRQLPPSRGWDGRAAERIANELGRRLALQPQEEN